MTLIETVVSMALLSVVSLAILALVATARRTARQAEMGFQAHVLVQTLLEREKHKDFSELLLSGPTALPLTEISTPLPYARAERSITPVVGLGGHVKEVIITVYWSELGRERSYRRLIRLSDLPR